MDNFVHFQARRTVLTILRMAKCKDKYHRDMRYEADWLLECYLLRIKSPTLYEHLRVRKILPLPCFDTVRALLRGMSPNFGINTAALDALEMHLAGRPLHECLGCLMYDELGLGEELKFDKQTYQFDGIVRGYNFDDEDDDWEEQDDQLEAKDDDIKLADHALVFIFRSYLLNFVQPIAVYPAKTAVPGKVLFRLFMRILIALEERGARVVTVVSDGAQTNATVWRLCNISGSIDGNNVMNHPKVDEPIFFMRDPPHLIKTCRNVFMKNDESQVGAYIQYLRPKLNIILMYDC